jgi:predicted nucleic acid-binding protein
MDYPPEKSAFSPVGLKKWRKAQKGAYKYVISEYRSIIKVLKDMVDLKIINVNVLNGDFECLLNEKIKFPELDANDCVHLVCAKKHCENIDCIVTCDKDFKSLIGKSTVKIHHINR